MSSEREGPSGSGERLPSPFKYWEAWLVSIEERASAPGAELRFDRGVVMGLLGLVGALRGQSARADEEEACRKSMQEALDSSVADYNSLLKQQATTCARADREESRATAAEERAARLEGALRELAKENLVGGEGDTMCVWCGAVPAQPHSPILCPTAMARAALSASSDGEGK